jgi:uncharacterized membrane protein YhhN
MDVGAARPATSLRRVTGWSWAFLGAAAVLAAGDWAAVARGSRRLEYACKPGTLLLLIAVAEAVDPASGAERAWFVAALGLSLAGDVLLMLPVDLFTGGLASFLLAHIAYVAGFRARGSSLVALAVAFVAVAALAIVPAARIITALRRSNHGDMVAPVAAYIAVISVMGASAIASGSALAGAGATLFMVSDTLIAWDRFVRRFRGARLAVIVTYHVGQAGLVVSLVR